MTNERELTWLDPHINHDGDASEKEFASFSSPALSRYLYEIRRYPLLSAEQEQALARRYSQGDAEAGNQLVCSNLRLVVYLAIRLARFTRHNVLDLIQEGNIGLMHAARKFDPTRNVRFSSYASYWIIQAIKRAMQEQEYPVHLPANLCAEIVRLKIMARRLAVTEGQVLVLAEVASAARVPARHLPSIQRWLAPCYSLEMPCLAEGELRSLSDVLRTLAPEKRAAQERREILQQLLDGLGPRERYVITLRYGLGPDGQEYTLEDIGAHLQITYKRVRQIEVRALRTLRKLAREATA